MPRMITFLASSAVVAVALSGPAFAQGAPQTVPQATTAMPAISALLSKIDPQVLATGYRTSKLVGSLVVNSANETVETLDDLIITPNEKIPSAVISVGGFLGIGAKNVVVPYGSLEVTGKTVTLRDATKESLKALPAYAPVAGDRTTSKVLGSAVFNSTNETLGTIDDLIVVANDKVPFAVLSVGGFVGMGSKYVVVSFSALELHENRLILRDATKESLKGLPEFKYSSN